MMFTYLFMICELRVMGPLGGLHSAHEGCGRGVSYAGMCCSSSGFAVGHTAQRAEHWCVWSPYFVFLAPSDAGKPSCAGMCRSAEAAAVSLPGMLRRAPAVDCSRWTWRTPLERTLPFWSGWCLPLTRHFCSCDYHC